MTRATNAMVWKVVGGTAVGAATLVTKKALDGTWRAATGNPPPTDPEDSNVAWGEAIVWAVVSGALIGLAQLVAARSVAHYMNRRAIE
jgi:hypothetical protein